MIRLGLVDCDTSHVVEFTKRFNHVDIAEDQWVEGAKVVAAVAGKSLISPELVAQYADKLKSYGVPFVDDPLDLIGKVDAVMIESVDGSVHKERALPLLERGMPLYVDKPFACSLADAKAMIDLASVKHLPMMSSSSLRYAPEVVEAREGKLGTGKILGATTFGPAPTHPRNPGLYHYGIHPVEMLFTLMGQGCKRVVCLSEPGGEIVTGVWSDGRVASVRGIRQGREDYGFTVFGEKAVVTKGVGTRYIYRELLKKIVAMFETRTPPIDPRETLEIVAFIEAAKTSGDRRGEPVDIKT